MASLFRVIVPVSNIEAAATFYRNVLGEPGQRVSPGRHYFNCGGTILACFDPKADGDGYDARPLPEPIYISVEDLESTYTLARDAGAVFSDQIVPEVGPLGSIALRPWGERSFYASDPFGNPLCFVSKGSEFTGAA
jgi:catechol 2,3-dioxygenase-like lactoylglutathione lyase family enzyme